MRNIVVSKSNDLKLERILSNLRKVLIKINFEIFELKNCCRKIQANVNENSTPVHSVIGKSTYSINVSFFKAAPIKYLHKFLRNIIHKNVAVLKAHTKTVNCKFNILYFSHSNAHKSTDLFIFWLIFFLLACVYTFMDRMWNNYNSHSNYQKKKNLFNNFPLL